MALAESGGPGAAPSADLTFAPRANNTAADTSSWLGANCFGELGNMTQLAMVVTTPPKAPLSLKAGDSKTLYFITALVTSLNSTDCAADAKALHAAATAGVSTLLAAHVAQWAARWESGSLDVEGDLFLAQALNSSLYAIRSSIRPDMPYGLSPGGLASNAYEGHTFWDQETWMWPPLLMLDPPCAKSALQYRWDRRVGARNKSHACGLPNHASSGGRGALKGLPGDALMFPWESCLTGTEVHLLKDPCCEFRM